MIDCRFKQASSSAARARTGTMNEDNVITLQEESVMVLIE